MPRFSIKLEATDFFMLGNSVKEIELKIRVIGIGSAIAGDDVVGLAVIRELSKRTLPDNVELVEAGTPGLSLVELMSGADKVILVDALVGGDRPGTVRKLRVHELLNRQSRVRSAHDIGVAEAVRLALDLKNDQLPEEILVIGVEVSGKVGMGGELSSNVRAAVPEAIRLVMSELK